MPSFCRYILWKFCSRGSIQDIIYNKNMSIDEKFHAAFVRDITLVGNGTPNGQLMAVTIQGLEYLHLSKIGFHGALSPASCVIDRNWSVRLTDFGLANMLERWQKENQIGTVKADEEEEEDTKKKGSPGRADRERRNCSVLDLRELRQNCLVYFFQMLPAKCWGNSPKCANICGTFWQQWGPSFLLKNNFEKFFNEFDCPLIAR